MSLIQFVLAFSACLPDLSHLLLPCSIESLDLFLDNGGWAGAGVGCGYKWVVPQKDCVCLWICHVGTTRLCAQSSCCVQCPLLRFGEYLRLPNKPLLNEDGSQPHFPDKMFRVITKARAYKKFLGKKKVSTKVKFL